MQRLTSIEDSEQALRQDIEELRRLATQAQRRRSSREEAERDAIRSEADSLAAVARPRLARRVEGLAAAAEQADENELADLRERLDGLRVRVERAVRLRAAKAHHAGRRWVRKAGQRAAAKRPGPAQEVNQSLEALAAALQKDDLAALRDRASGARAALRKVALTARPWFRVALAGAAVLVLAASFLAWRQAGHRPQTYSLKLDAQPREPVSIWLVRDGEIVGRRQYSGGNDGVSFDLDPGRYEVFVNERYTGRVVSVPGQREVTGIPLPVPYQ